MSKRYITVITVLVTLVACFFLFFDKKSNKEIYTEYITKLENASTYSDLSSNGDLKVAVSSDYINNQYHYVLTFTSTKTLSSFKALAMTQNMNHNEYYPSFGIFDNKNIDLVNDNVGDNQTKGVNLVISNKEEVEAFKVYVSYNNYEYYYLISVEE